MMTKKSIGAAVAVVALTLGAAPAWADHNAWGGFSQAYEPNTMWDTAGYMPQQSNSAAVEKIYFNGLIVKDSVAALNPYEVQVADGNVLGPEGYFFAAVLGYWRDCNGDDYIGAKNVPASMGNFEVYPRDAYEIDTSICPLGSPYNPVNRITGDPDGWIDEFRWVGPGGGWDSYEQQVWARVCANPPSVIKKVECAVGVTSGDPNGVTDNRSKVWADWGHPGFNHIPFQGLTGGHPPGTYQDSDGTLRYVDDATAQTLSATLGSAWTNKPNIGDCGAPADTPQLLGGPDGSCGLWPLYQVKRLVNDGNAETGNEDQPTPLVTVFDIEDDDGGDDNPCTDFVSMAAGPGYVAIADPDPSVNENFLVQGSTMGTVANVQAGVNATRTSNGAQGAGECGSGDTATGSLETNTQDAELTHRQPDDWLTFTRDQRWHYLDAQGFQDMPADGAGIRGGVTGLVTDSPGWFGQVGWTPRPPRHGWGSLTTMWASFYADVTAQGISGAGATNTVALPSAQQDRWTYGVPEYCLAVVTGASSLAPNDWECSRDVWHAKRIIDGVAERAILGDKYDLRDVDCFDNTISYSMAPGVKLGASEGCEATH